MKDMARRGYFGLVRKDRNVAHLADTQFIGIPAGSFGTVGGTPLPTQSTILNQGGLTIVTSGTSLTQPLSELWKIRSTNDFAPAQLKETRGKPTQMETQ